MKKLALMIQFLTRIPLPVHVNLSDEEFKDGIIYFPLVGLIIGMFIVAFYYIGFKLGGVLLGAVMAVAAEAFITGGLHLDGLGDTFDGVYSNRPKDKILEIMKDSRLGTNAALAIMLTILLKIAFIQGLSIDTAYPVLLLMPVFSRLCMVFVCGFSVYARPSGMGNLFIGRVSNAQMLMSIGIALLLSLIYPITIGYFLIAFGFSVYYIKHISHKIGGMTGDTLGAACELSELLYLFYIVTFFYISR